MATERKVRAMSSFFKFTEIGDMAAGKVREFKSGENGTFMILSPVLVRKGRKGTVEQFQSAAVGLKTDLSLKIDTRSDIGALLQCTYTDDEPTKKGNPKKIFTVLLLTQDEIGKLAATADRSHKDEPYHVEPEEKSEIADETEDDSEDDDLPF